jgi:putative Ca2+/H+ antiporter (TMEM165/GDT1 family)
MSELLIALASAFGVVFVAELGDKTQLLALGFGARYRLRTVALGLLLGYGMANVIASVVGGALGAALPERPISIAAGLLFLLFAALALRDDGNVEEEGGGGAVRTHSVVASIALTIAVAEMGDKTQLATAALSARNDPVGTWIGATLGAAGAGMVGAFAGQRIGARIHPRTLQLASAGLFAAFGVLLLVTA